MVETKRSRDQSSVMNEFIIEENLESDDSEYMPSEHENSDSDFLDSENDHCDATDEICDGPVHGSVEKSLGFVPHNTSVVSSDSDDDVESLHSASSDNSDSHNVRTCRGQVRSNIRHNTPLVATPIASAPLTPPESPHLSPPATAPPFPAPLAPAPSVSAPSIIDRATKLPFQRSTKVHLKRTAGRQISPQQPAPYQVVRWMMQQTTNSENVLPTSQESIGSFKPKTN
ncbi:hypothetical protein V6N11_021954 [Hibiscus sabdariffa]|uniref:Uncharacterized protein n=1 Tax=Hibiscus sabdariffa TaxID=183260 RepID=A0ABR2THR6_9ROSI